MDHVFRSPWAGGSIALRPVVRQKGMTEKSCSPHDGQEAEREERARDKIYPSSACLSDLLPLPPNSSSISELMQWGS